MITSKHLVGMGDLERWYKITGNGRLQMRDRTPRECEEFRRNLRRLVDAKMINRDRK